MTWSNATHTLGGDEKATGRPLKPGAIHPSYNCVYVCVPVGTCYNARTLISIKAATLEAGTFRLLLITLYDG